MTEDRDKKGQFAQGTSGNINGRPRGVKNKRMSNKDVLDYLGKKKEYYFRRIEEIAEIATTTTIELQDEDGNVRQELNPSFDPKLAFSCFKELIGFDIQVDIFEYKKLQDKNKNRRSSKTTGESEEDEPDMNKVLSFTNR